MVITLKKASQDWWDGLSKDKGLKRFIKADFSKWCEEDDKEYTGDFATPEVRSRTHCSLRAPPG